MNNRHWTTDECKTICDYYPKYGATYCSELLNRSRSGISNKAGRLGLKTCIVSGGRPKKEIIELLPNGKIMAICIEHGSVPHYTSLGRITGCVECVRQSNANKPRTEKRRTYDRLKARKYRATPLGRYTSRLRSYLSRFLKNKNGCFRHLPYSPKQLCNHLETIREKQNNQCPTCYRSYAITGTNIDHIIPLATATTETEILQLFNLDNLSLLCPTCNCRKGPKVGEKICVH